MILSTSLNHDSSNIYTTKRENMYYSYNEQVHVHVHYMYLDEIFTSYLFHQFKG